MVYIHYCNLCSCNPCSGIEAPSLSPDFACISPPVDESGSGMQTVPIATYADAFVRSDPDNWCARMMLVDHISHVQEKICKRMMVIEKEIEGPYYAIITSHLQSTLRLQN